MQKKKQNHAIKQITLFIAIIILLLLLIFAEDIIKLTQKNKTNLAENLENELISSEPNIPYLSAGMIPVKWENEQFVITTKEDKDWYDYSNGKPAYIMLNDGTYQSELIRDMTNKELAENNIGVGVPDDPQTRGTIFMWIPRFAYKETGEIGYIKEETTLGGDWIVPELFMHKIADETKPDFSLSGVWIEKDVDTNYASKISRMNQEESIYGFIANTVGVGVSDDPSYKDTIQIYTVGNDALVVPLTDPTNLNRIILKIINTSKHEPIKSKIAHNKEEQKIEITITYTANGINKVIDEYGQELTITEENGIICADTANMELVRGTYKFTIIDNKENKKELSIKPNIDALYKVAYINGTDNMDNTATYNKTQETKTTEENTLLNKIKETDTSKIYSRAITDSNNAITAISQQTRTAEDEQLYIYNRYKKEVIGKKWVNDGSPTNYQGYTTPESGKKYYGFRKFTINESTGLITLSDCEEVKCDGKHFYLATTTVMTSYKSSATVTGYLYYIDANKKINSFRIFKSTSYQTNKYGKGDFISSVIDETGKYPENDYTGSYWYMKGSLSRKYTLHKYTSDLTLLSTYDVDTATLTTAPIDISNKGRNKLKLTLTATGTDYKTYISNDNTNWKEVTEIASNTPKELEVDGWNNLYIKIVTNTSRINNIDIAYYKD